MPYQVSPVLTVGACCSTFSPLSSSSPSPKPSGKPVNLSFTAVRQAFSDARRRALRTQGVVTLQKARANQLTMKSVCRANFTADEMLIGR